MIYLITLGFTPNKLFRHTAERLQASLSGKHEIQKVFIAKPYPVEPERNLALNITHAAQRGYNRIHIREKDSGAAQDFNLALKELNVRDQDIVIVYDHDIYPIQDGWDDAAISVMQADEKVDWVCMWNCASDNEFGARGGIPVTIAGHRCMQAIGPMMAMTSVIRGSFLNYCGGLIQPCPMYGGVELYMWPKLVERGTKKVFLMDFKEDQRLKQYQDDFYQKWKGYHVTGRFPGSFAQFVDEGCPDK
jgi:hypothetical protein